MLMHSGVYNTKPRRTKLNISIFNLATFPLWIIQNKNAMKTVLFSLTIFI